MGFQSKIRYDEIMRNYAKLNNSKVAKFMQLMTLMT